MAKTEKLNWKKKGLGWYAVADDGTAWTVVRPYGKHRAPCISRNGVNISIAPGHKHVTPKTVAGAKRHAERLQAGGEIA